MTQEEFQVRTEAAARAAIAVYGGKSAEEPYERTVELVARKIREILRG